MRAAAAVLLSTIVAVLIAAGTTAVGSTIVRLVALRAPVRRLSECFILRRGALALSSRLLEIHTFARFARAGIAVVVRALIDVTASICFPVAHALPFVSIVAVARHVGSCDEFGSLSRGSTPRPAYARVNSRASQRPVLIEVAGTARRAGLSNLRHAIT